MTMQNAKEDNMCQIVLYKTEQGDANEHGCCIRSFSKAKNGDCKKGCRQDECKHLWRRRKSFSTLFSLSASFHLLAQSLLVTFQLISRLASHDYRLAPLDTIDSELRIACTVVQLYISYRTKIVWQPPYKPGWGKEIFWSRYKCRLCF